MTRRAAIQPRQLEPDAVHGSVLVSQLVNRLMLDEEAHLAESLSRDESVSPAALDSARPRLADLLVAVTGDYVAGRQLLRPSVWWRY